MITLMLPAIVIDIARGMTIAVFAVAVARALLPLIGRRWVAAMLAAWLAIPALAIAYAWALNALPWLQMSAMQPVLHVMIAAIRLAPAALAMVLLAPSPPLGAAGYHCLKLMHGGGAWCRPRLLWAWWTRGPGRAWLVASLLLFPLGFSEFEIGSRFAIGVWSVRLFDAQSGGQLLSHTLGQAWPGIAAQITAMAVAYALMRRSGLSRSLAVPAVSPLAWGAFVLGSIALIGAPLTLMLRDTVIGIGGAGTIGIASEIIASVVFATAAATCAWLAASAISRSTGRLSVARVVLLPLLIAVSMCGSLVIGLVVLALFQSPIIRNFAGTPLPLLLALVILLLPYAVILRAFVESRRRSSAWHITTLMRAGTVDHRRDAAAMRWKLVGTRRWWSWSLLFLWGYADLAASAILHPVDMTPVLVLLYNFMHYGRSAGLSLRLGLAVVVPLALVIIGCWAMRGIAMRVSSRPAVST